MEKNIRKLLSNILVLVMLFNMIPLNAFATETNTQPPTNTAGQEAVSNDVSIVEEIIEERSEYIKQFRMSNGLQMAAVYASPVHYEADGRWEEIDNTLQLATARSGNAYVNTAGVWQVRFPQNMSEDNGVTITKDGHIFIFRMAGELLVPELQDVIVESEMFEILDATDETVVTEEETTPTTVETIPLNESAAIPEESVETSGTEEMETAMGTEKDAAEDMSVESTEERTEVVQETVVPQEEQTTETVGENLAVVSAPAESVAAEIEVIDMEAVKAETEYPETVVEKINSRLSYKEIYEDTDIIFDLKSNQVKESIVMKEYRDTLMGYVYALEVGDMIPVLMETGEIELRSADEEDVILYMPAPYLIDDAGSTCFDINVSLEGENGKYILAYELPREWLSDEARQWPVVLDPAVQPTLDMSNIRDTTVCAKGGYAYGHGTLLCGYYGSNQVCRIYVKYLNLPALTSADMIVSADMRMCTLYTNYNSSKATPVMEVHKVNSVWESQTITWANKPDYDPTVEDYAVASTKETFYNWDVTDLVRGWYEGENTGMMFKMSDSVESAANVYSQFYSSDYSYYQEDLPLKPTLTIIFRNNNGLEGYWDYTASAAGRAGTGYVNQYTGNLVWLRNDIGFGGNRMPVTISHVYNTNDSTENQFGMGNGWRTNFNQMVYHWDNDNAYGDYYVWEDSDGTDHYFYYESANTYKDEDGLELTLTTNGTETDAKYCITDKNGNASYFDICGRLTKQSNYQATKSSITITYTTATGKLISTIIDGAGRVYTFTYTNNLLSQIAYKGKVSEGVDPTSVESITYVDFGYTDSNLTSVTDKDGKTSSYTYTTNNLLSTAQDIDGYKICYDYTTTTAGQPNRIKTIEEYSGTTAGGVVNLEYAHNQTKFTDHNGNMQIVQFNNMGNTISIQDDLGRAQYAQYAVNDPVSDGNTLSAKGNQLILSSKLQNTVGNVLKDSSFENSRVWIYATYDVSQVISTDTAYHGSKSLKMTRSAAGTATGVCSDAFTVAAGECYTFSAYVRTTGSAYLLLGDGSTSVTSETLSKDEWTRLEVSYTNTSSAAKNVRARLMTAAAGTTYMDCVQVEKAPTASRYNLIENGDFVYSGYAWNTSNGRTTVTAANKAPAPQLDVNVYKMTGNPQAENRISQTVNVSGSKNDTFVLAGWAKADSVPLTGNRDFALIATFKNGTTTVNTAKVQFNPCADSTVAWQYAAAPIVAAGAYTSIVIELAYDYNANTAYFDGIQLYKEEFGNSYTYDEDGNIISVKNVQSQTTTYEYTNNNLTKQTLPSGAVLTYTYDNYHNVKTATSDTGVVYSFGYDTYGNNTSVSVGTGSVKLTSSAAYTNSGNVLSSTTDAAGKVTKYGYNLNTNVLEWVQYPGDSTSTRTEYSYDSMYRLAKAETDVSTGSTLSAEYGYSNDLLTSIKTGSTNYSFTYGAFALRSNIKIGSRTLATYTYTSRNNFLDTLAYGNGDSVKYTYDKQGRVTKQTYEDGDTVSYAYDNNGALASVTDSATGITTKYYYDFTNRLMKYKETGSGYSHSVGYEYDEINNLTVLVETINGVQHETAYIYDDDNRITEVSNGSVEKQYVYDAYGRLVTQITTQDGTTVQTESFTYTNPSASTTSAQIKTHTIQSAGTTVTYTYTYDNNGNILSVCDGSNTTSYVYDSANQLLRENNQAGGFTHVWTYHDAGNILKRQE
jgi:YD repeat-containing protein